MKRVLLAITAVAVLVLSLVVAFVIWNAVTSTSKGDVERMLRENLPPGSSAEEVFLFLEHEDIDHGEIHRAGVSSRLVDAGVPRETEVIGGIIRNTSHGFLYTGNINFWLILDDQRRVVDYHLEDVYDGP